MTKIAIPIMKDHGDQSLPSDHFGRAPLFYIIDGDQTLILKNNSDHFGGTGKPPENLINYGINILIAKNMGRKAIEIFQNADVAVFRTTSQPITKILDDFHAGNLDELTEGCNHSKH